MCQLVGVLNSDSAAGESWGAIGRAKGPGTGLVHSVKKKGSMSVCRLL